MLRIDNLKLPVGVKEDKLRAACAHALRVSEEAPAPLHRRARGREARLLLRGRGQKRIRRFTALQE
mgnify:CR=1 FL=1